MLARWCIWLVAILAWPLAAQWVHYPTPGIPRTPDGKPDFSGLWEKTAGKRYDDIVANLKPGEMQPWIAEVSVEGNSLFWSYDGTGKQKLDPVSESIFSLAGTSIEFLRSGSGPAKAPGD